jgi:hypothetical protein
MGHVKSVDLTPLSRIVCQAIIFKCRNRTDVPYNYSGVPLNFPVFNRMPFFSPIFIRVFGLCEIKPPAVCMEFYFSIKKFIEIGVGRKYAPINPVMDFAIIRNQL